MTIVANPEDKLIGTTGLTTYPVHEINGMIFVFVREDSFPMKMCRRWQTTCRSAFRKTAKSSRTRCGLRRRAY